MNLQVLALVVISVSTSARAELQLVGDFDAQVQHILAEEFLRPEQYASLTRVYDDLRHTLKQAWPAIRILPIGSLVTRLALQNSDVDLVVKVNEHKKMTERRFVKHALELFQRDNETYSHVTEGGSKGARNIPLIHLTHRATGRKSDISFSSQTSVENSRLLAYYLKLDHRIAPLISIIKFWINTQEPDKLRSCVVYALVIFYLEQKLIIPPPIVLLEDFRDRYENKWDTHFNMIPFKSNNTENLYQLLGGFFEYYSTFNFRDNVLALRNGKIYPRSVFLNINTIPEVFAVYKDYLKRPGSRPLELNSDLCIQDSFGQNNNLGNSVSSDLAADFLAHLNSAAKAFEDVTSDRFLPAILTKI